MLLPVAANAYHGYWSPDGMPLDTCMAGGALFVAGLSFVCLSRKSADRLANSLAGSGYAAIGAGLISWAIGYTVFGSLVASGGVVSILVSLVLPSFLQSKKRGL